MNFSELEELTELPDGAFKVIARVDSNMNGTVGVDDVYGYVMKDMASDTMFVVPYELMHANERTGHAKRLTAH